MEYTEKTIRLSPEEIEGIRSKRRRTLFGIGLFLILYYTVLYVIFRNSPGDGVFTAAAGFFAVFPWIIVFMVIYSAARDIRRGEKMILRGTIESKEERTSGSSRSSGSTSTSYYFIMNGREISVPLLHYREYHAGDAVEIEMLPYSSDILAVRTLEKAPEKPVPFFSSGAGYSSDTIPMSMEDEAMLRRLRNKRIFRTLLWLIPLGVIAYIALTILLAVLFIKSRPGGIPSRFRIAYISMIVMLVLLLAYILYRRIILLLRDLGGGMKEVLRVVVQDKQHSNVRIISKNWRLTSSRGDFFYLVVQDDYHEVTREIFEQIEAGQTVRLHRAPNSGVLLKMERG